MRKPMRLASVSTLDHMYDDRPTSKSSHDILPKTKHKLSVTENNSCLQ